MSGQPKDLWHEERRLYASGFRAVCGADEAGAGPLAGPVYAAAVILPFEVQIEGLDDSKRLTPKKREALFDVICGTAIAYAITFVDAEQIDEINILNARIRAMDEAIRSLSPAADMALIDGNRDHGTLCAIQTSHELLVGGDGRSANIAAASILAKVSRDRYMEEMAEQYPQYGFEKHKGYGTKAHYEALDAYGISPLHRRSFLKKWNSKAGDSRWEKQSVKAIGAKR